MKTILKYGTLLLLITHSWLSGAQEFSITNVELAGDKLVIFYDLIDTVKNRHYTVHVYSSMDSYLNPLEKISGDAGLEVAPGKHKKITWNIAEELAPDFEGKVGLEVRGRLYVPFVRFTGFEDYGIRKRGVPFVITWSGGTRLNVLNFDLYQEDTKIWTQPSVANTGNFEMTIPTSVKPGRGYLFRISDTKNKDQVVFTSEFAIKRKIPLGLKAIPLLAAGAAAFYIISGSGDDESFRIPNAPCPGNTDDCN